MHASVTETVKLRPMDLELECAAVAHSNEVCVHLQAAYSRLRMDSTSGVVDWPCVEAAFSRYVAPLALKRLFLRWDKGKVGVAHVDAMLVTLACCCNGSLQEKAKLAFSLFDPTSSGHLSASEVLSALLLV